METSKQEAELCNSKFVELYEQGEYEQALHYIINATTADPNHTDSLYNYATFLQEISKDYTKAQQYYALAVESDPKDAFILNSYAQFLRHIVQDFDQAEHIYQQAVAASPTDTTIMNNYAQFLRDVRKDYSKAEEYYKKAIEFNSNSASLLNNYAQFLKQVKRDFDVAEDYYKKAIEVNPNHSFSLNNYAQFLKEVRRDFEKVFSSLLSICDSKVKAEVYYKKAIRANPNHIDMLYNYALFLMAIKKDYDQAEQLLAKCIESNPHHTLSLYSYAQLFAYIHKGYDQAQELFLRAVESNNKIADIYYDYALFSWNCQQDRVLTEKILAEGLMNNPDSKKLSNLLNEVKLENQAMEGSKQKKRTNLEFKSADNSTKDLSKSPKPPPPFSPSGGRSDGAKDKNRTFIPPPRVLEPLGSMEGKSPMDLLEPKEGNLEARHGETEGMKLTPLDKSTSNSTVPQPKNEGSSAPVQLSTSPYLWYIDPKNGKDAKYNITTETTNIGRKEDNDVALLSKYVSRYHARIDMEVRGGVPVFVFKDLAERSKINGEKPVDHVLKRGDQIKLGKTLLMFLDKSDAPLLLNPDKEGPGWKQSSKLLKNWQAHQFLLKYGVLYFFKGAKPRMPSQIPDGMLDLDGCTIEKDEETTFSIESNKKIYNLKFTPSEVKEEWLEIIRMCASGR